MPRADVNFAIVGMVRNDKRNYASIEKALTQLAQLSDAQRIQIWFLGSSDTPLGHALAEKITQRGLQNMFYFQQVSYLPLENLLGLLADMQFIVPLIDKQVLCVAGSEYNVYLSPSAVMLSRAVGVPLVVSRDFDLDDDIQDFAIWYTGDNVLEGLNNGVVTFNSGDYPAICERYKQHMVHIFTQSCHQYLELE